MDNYMLSGLIASLFVICKYLDLHFIQKTQVNTKVLIRDCVTTFIVSIIAFNIKDYFGETTIIPKGPTPAYTGEAAF